MKKWTFKIKKCKKKYSFYYFLELGRRGNLQLQHIFLRYHPENCCLIEKAGTIGPLQFTKAWIAASLRHHHQSGICRSCQGVETCGRAWPSFPRSSKVQLATVENNPGDCDGHVDAFINTTAIRWCSFAVRWCDFLGGGNSPTAQANAVFSPE